MNFIVKMDHKSCVFLNHVKFKMRFAINSLRNHIFVISKVRLRKFELLILSRREPQNGIEQCNVDVVLVQCIIYTWSHSNNIWKCFHLKMWCFWLDSYLVASSVIIICIRCTDVQYDCLIVWILVIGQAIDLDPTDAKFFSNRSLCWIRLGQAEQALADAKACRSLRPKWAKACYREGVALRALLVCLFLCYTCILICQTHFTSLYFPI